MIPWAVAETLFDPTHYVDIRRPLLDATILSSWYRTSPEFYDRKVQRIFMRIWNLVGCEAEISG